MFVSFVTFHLPWQVLFFKYLKRLERTPAMITITRAAEYRYFSFTYFMGKAYFGLAENVCA